MTEHYHAAQAASFLFFNAREGGDSVRLRDGSVSGHAFTPRPLRTDRTAPRRIIAAFGPGASGRVRVYPDRFLFYCSKTYVACPGGPGKNQLIARAHARARVFRLLSSDLLFYLLLKVLGQPGQLFNFMHFRSDSHPDAPGPLGPNAFYGGLATCL